jgi:hypothetical protein
MRLRLLTLATLTLLAACSDSSSGGGGNNGGSTDFNGILSSTDGSESGSLLLTVATASPSAPSPVGPSLVSPVDVTGSLKFAGSAAVPLTGTYDPGTSHLTATGGGYDLDGGFDGSDRLEGTYTGPSTDGTFVTTKSTSAVAYCGAFQADDLSNDGSFSFTISGTTVRGQAVSTSDPTPIPLDGTYDTSTHAITILVPGSQLVLATGTLNTGTGAVTGNYDTHAGETGTWQGAVCQ